MLLYLFILSPFNCWKWHNTSIHTHFSVVKKFHIGLDVLHTGLQVQKNYMLYKGGMSVIYWLLLKRVKKNRKKQIKIILTNNTEVEGCTVSLVEKVQ